MSSSAFSAKRNYIEHLESVGQSVVFVRKERVEFFFVEVACDVGCFSFLLPNLIAGIEKLFHYLLRVISEEALCAESDVVETKRKWASFKTLLLIGVVGVQVNVIMLFVVVEQLCLRCHIIRSRIIRLLQIQTERIHEQRLADTRLADEQDVLVKTVLPVGEYIECKRRTVEVIKQKTQYFLVVLVHYKAFLFLRQEIVPASNEQLRMFAIDGRV